MRRSWRWAAFAVVSVLLSASVLAAGIGAGHQRWLERDVGHIITEYERSAFKGLPDAAARDNFITAFWQARDPTPGTTANEFREEHYRRLEAAGRLFQTGRNKGNGWKGERGRVYIQLGPPNDRVRYEMLSRLHPIEQWTYSAPPGSELPKFFHLLFFKPHGVGRYELYDPVSDGPEALIGGYLDSESQLSRSQSQQQQRQDAFAGSSRSEERRADEGQRLRMRALQELGAVSPTLQRASLSLDLSDPADITTGRVTPGAMRVVGRVQAFNERRPVDRAYVERILAGKANVEVEYSLRNLGLAATFHGGFGHGGELHTAYLLPAASLSLQRFDDATSGAFEIVGRIFDATTGEPALQIEERMEFTLDKQQLRRVESFPLALEDRIPLLPGRYRASLLVRNLISREVGRVGGEFEVPAVPAEGPLLGPILLVRGSLPTTDETAPVTFAGLGFQPSDGRVMKDGEIHAVAELVGGARDGSVVHWSIADDQGPERLHGSVDTQPASADGATAVVVRHPASRLAPGRHLLRMSIGAGDGTSATREVAFEVVAGSGTPGVGTRPAWVYVHPRQRGPLSSALALAEQELGRGADAAAIRLLEAATAAAPGAVDLSPLRVRLAELRLGRHEFPAAAAAVEPLASAPSPPAYAMLLLGLARSAAGDSAGAIRAYDLAHASAPDDPRILGVLGEEWLRAGDAARAIPHLRRSLALAPEQPRVLELVRRAESP